MEDLSLAHLYGTSSQIVPQWVSYEEWITEFHFTDQLSYSIHFTSPGELGTGSHFLLGRGHDEPYSGTIFKNDHLPGGGGGGTSILDVTGCAVQQGVL